MADTKLSNLSAVTSVTAADEFVLARSGVSNKITASNLLMFDAYAYLRNEQAANTNGGIATSGSFQTLVINTEVFDPAGIVSLSSNQFVLAAGTYMIRGRAPFFRTDKARIVLRNVTDSTNDILGNNVTSETTVNGEGTVTADLFGRVTIAGSKTFELQYRIGASAGNSKELGVSHNFGINEVYAEVEIWREA